MPGAMYFFIFAKYNDESQCIFLSKSKWQWNWFMYVQVAFTDIKT